ncbi:MAG: cupin domain-containing protein [Patescibacteria group bacterium]
MKFVSRKETTVHKNSESCIATEYPLGDTDLDFATVEIAGRYPDEGRVMNLKSKEIALVLKGHGKIVIEGKEVVLNEGDVILVEPGEKYFWDGTMSIAVACTPPWSMEQHKKIT